MNELEFRAERARFYHRCLMRDELSHRYQWCVYVGLWETSGWIREEEDRIIELGHASQYDLLKLVIPGQRGYKNGER